MSAPPSSSSDDLEKKISDVIRVEGGIIAFSMVALGFLLNAISSFNQTNIGLKQIGMITKLCGYVPIAPTFQYFVFIVLADVASLSTGLFSRIIPSKYSKWKLDLIVTSVFCLLISLGIFTYMIWRLQFAFYYPPC
jgi:uncharacterized membrane protein YuzA (DUF378 family)